ncbi:glycosyltransferase [Streptomyces sanglieri]
MVDEDKNSPDIGLFLPTFTPGGIERCMINLAKGFISRGVKVDLIVADKRGSFEEKVPNKATIINLNAGRIIKSVIPLIKYLQQREPSILLSGHTHANIVAVWSVKVANTNTGVAIGIHNSFSNNYRGEIKVKDSIIRKLVPLTYRRSDHIIAVSKGVARDISSEANIKRENIDVIYNPVIGEDIKYLDDKSITEPWLVNSAIQVILGVGRLTQQKDFETLIKSFYEVQKVNKNARLIIIGSGPKKDDLEDLIDRLGIQSKVKIIEYVEDIYSVMKESDIFVLSSRWEGFGIVLVEAMAVGTPVVATNCPTGPNEILKDGEYGELVPVGDPLSMANAINEMLNRRDEEKRTLDIQKRAMDFSIPSVVDEYMDVLNI